MTDYPTDIKRYTASVDEKAVAGIVKHLGIALKSKDAAIVSCSSQGERARIRDSWLKKKLALEASDAELDQAIKATCEAMKADTSKSRVTFYYLLAERYGKLSMLA
jgi:fructose-1-phosphate kinase PfkB-like protein